MTPERARYVARAYKAVAEQFAELGVPSEATRMERDSARWLAYADTLANAKPEGP
jgi:hypothetical protein